MEVGAKIKFYQNVVDYFKKLSFCNKPIEKPEIKRLKTLIEVLFYEELSVIKTNHAFKGYAMSYKI